MADIRAFRAIRYDLGHVGQLSSVVAPPYDVIDADLQRQLYDRSPYNAIRLELTKDEPGDDDRHNRYTRAANTLREWQAADVLAQDSARGLYVLHQEYTVEGKTYTRRGFFARVRLEPFGTGSIFPHEETMSGPKADRLKLYHATGMNVSPVFGLYPDPDGAVQAKLDDAVRRSLPLEATDHLGTVSRLWPVTDQAVVSAVTGLMSPKPIFIADGHHRYETGLRYLEEKRSAGDVPNDEAAPNFILMNLVGMSDPGLSILPTHRILSGLPDLTGPQLRDLLDKHFTVEVVGNGSAGMRECWENIEADGSQDLLGFGTAADGVWQTARFRDADVMARLEPNHSTDWRNLGVSILHSAAIGLCLASREQRPPGVKYVHLLSEVEEAVRTKAGQVFALVPPATMGHVERIAGNREKMPPKSTYFYPKVLTGLVYNSLKGN